MEWALGFALIAFGLWAGSTETILGTVAAVLLIVAGVWVLLAANDR